MVTNPIVNAQSQFDTQAEAQFEFSKIVNDLQNRINEKNPQTYDEVKQIARDYFSEVIDRINNLKPEVKLELCKMFSDSANIIFGRHYESGLCESFALNNSPASPVQTQQPSVVPREKPPDQSHLIVEPRIAKDQLKPGENQTISILVKNPLTNDPETNLNVEFRVSDSSGKGVHSSKGYTDLSGNYSHSWKISSKSPNSYFTVSVLINSPSFPNWATTLYFNKTEDQIRCSQSFLLCKY